MNPLAAQMLAFRSQAQAFTEQTLPARVKIGDSPREFPCSCGGIHDEDQLDKESGGFVKVSVVSFRIFKTILPSQPANNSRIFWVDQNRELRIRLVGTGGLTDPTWLLTCESPSE